ncbi:MAG: DUF1517 domain-containing protein [Cyanobacteria bacterium P01_H01_bin.15]
MRKHFPNFFKKLGKALLILTLAFTLLVSSADAALAARSGGRMGGGSFRAPTRSYTSRPVARSGGYGYGGGMGFPFLLPFVGFGGFGSLFSILVFFAVINFLIQAFRNSGLGGDAENNAYAQPSFTIMKVQVGMSANARALQQELNQMALRADTGSASGRARVLQEATLALLRHPEYWTYGAAEAEVTNFASAEAKFNQYALGERSKFLSETLSNVDSQLRNDAQGGSLVTQDGSELQEYIVATLVVGTEGKLSLGQVNDSDSLRLALQTVGGIGSDRLQAVEILWTPQAIGDTLTQDDLLANYPNLRLV